MPFTLPLLFYKMVQEKLQKKFEEHNFILEFKDIESVVSSNDTRRSLQIFFSAIVDHRSVDGRSFYLSPPLKPLFYHDDFKRCLIADAVHTLSKSSDDDIRSDVARILNALYDFPSAEYVNVFVWAGLGQMVRTNPGFFDEIKQRLYSDLSGSVTSVLGVIVFLDQLKERQGVVNQLHCDDFLKNNVRYKIQKVLIAYYLKKNSKVFDFNCEDSFFDSDICAFLRMYEKKSFGGILYFEEGLKEIGFIPRSQTTGLYPGSQQAKIAGLLRKLCAEYISVIGFYMRHIWN